MELEWKQIFAKMGGMEWMICAGQVCMKIKTKSAGTGGEGLISVSM